MELPALSVWVPRPALGTPLESPPESCSDAGWGAELEINAYESGSDVGWGPQTDEENVTFIANEPSKGHLRWSLAPPVLPPGGENGSDETPPKVLKSAFARMAWNTRTVTQTAAALQIQRWWRSACEQFARVMAALRLQRAYQRWRQRLAMMACLRQLVARARSQHKQNIAIIVIQSWWRASSVRQQEGCNNQRMNSCSRGLAKSTRFSMGTTRRGIGRCCVLATNVRFASDSLLHDRARARRSRSPTPAMQALPQPWDQTGALGSRTSQGSRSPVRRMSRSPSPLPSSERFAPAARNTSLGCRSSRRRGSSGDPLPSTSCVVRCPGRTMPERMAVPTNIMSTAPAAYPVELTSVCPAELAPVADRAGHRRCSPNRSQPVPRTPPPAFHAPLRSVLQSGTCSRVLGAVPRPLPCVAQQPVPSESTGILNELVNCGLITYAARETTWPSTSTVLFDLVTVSQLLAAALPAAKVCSIARVDCSVAAAAYTAVRDALGPEKLLWHGTAWESVSNIVRHGFNRAYAYNGRHGARLGRGSYFAEDPAYALRFCGRARPLKHCFWLACFLDGSHAVKMVWSSHRPCRRVRVQDMIPQLTTRASHACIAYSEIFRPYLYISLKLPYDERAGADAFDPWQCLRFASQ